MKLKDDFFKITSSTQTATGMDYTIALNPEHFIYRAHFPENPITPGVCIIQIIKELAEEILKQRLFLKEVINTKFLNVINPLENNEIMISVSVTSEGDKVHKIGAVVSDKNNQFSKLSLLFVNQ
jgi:3-hydroxyacyl-[acyl-carrier-protein] dehydratase